MLSSGNHAHDRADGIHLKERKAGERAGVHPQDISKNRSCNLRTKSAPYSIRVRFVGAYSSVYDLVDERAGPRPQFDNGPVATVISRIIALAIAPPERSMAAILLGAAIQAIRNERKSCDMASSRKSGRTAQASIADEATAVIGVRRHVAG